MRFRKRTALALKDGTPRMRVSFKKPQAFFSERTQVEEDFSFVSKESRSPQLYIDSRRTRLSLQTQSKSEHDISTAVVSEKTMIYE